MFKKQKGERGEKERKGTGRIRRPGQAGEAETLAAGSLEGSFSLSYSFFLFFQGETEATGSGPCAAAFQTVKNLSSSQR